MTPLAARPPSCNRLLQAGIIGLGLGLALLVGAAGLGLAAIQQGYLRPPGFAVQLGRVEFAAPCPARGFDCDPSLPYYAVWRGDPQPDGSTRYRQLYFWYLKPAKYP